MTPQPPDSSKPFGAALRDLLANRGEYTTTTGNVKFKALADAIDKHYEVLRKAVAGERGPNDDLIERVSLELGVRPTYFLEYRIRRAQESFDPAKVGREQALENLRRWLSG